MKKPKLIKAWAVVCASGRAHGLAYGLAYGTEAFMLKRDAVHLVRILHMKPNPVPCGPHRVVLLRGSVGGKASTKARSKR